MDADLERFVDAQRDTFDGALAELRAGRKVGHWIWWVFPQLRGLGRSANSAYYGLTGADEARNYAAHAVLGPRLRQAIAAVVEHRDIGAESVLGPDSVKLRSSLTLFARVVPEDPIFRVALTTMFDGHEDPLTLELLKGAT